MFYEKSLFWISLFCCVAVFGCQDTATAFSLWRSRIAGCTQRQERLDLLRQAVGSLFNRLERNINEQIMLVQNPQREGGVVAGYLALQADNETLYEKLESTSKQVSLYEQDDAAHGAQFSDIRAIVHAYQSEPRLTCRGTTAVTVELPAVGQTQVTVVPSLRQDLSQYEPRTEYCAYFALFNAMLFLRGNVDSMRHIEEFVPYFSYMLEKVKTMRWRPHPYTCLASMELLELISDFGLKDSPLIVLSQSDILAPYFAGMTFDDVMAENQHAVKVIQRFNRHEIPSICVVAGTGLNGCAAHWMAMQFRHGCGEDIQASLADSLLSEDKIAVDGYLRNKVELFYYLFTNNAERIRATVDAINLTS